MLGKVSEPILPNSTVHCSDMNCPAGDTRVGSSPAQSYVVVDAIGSTRLIGDPDGQVSALDWTVRGQRKPGRPSGHWVYQRASARKLATRGRVMEFEGIEPLNSGPDELGRGDRVVRVSPLFFQVPPSCSTISL